MPFLIAVDGPLKGLQFPLKRRMVLGRSFDADIQIDDLTVSRHHCQIAATRRGCLLRDLGSPHGTYLNDKLIKGPVRLREGDTIRLRNSVFRFALRKKTKPPTELVDLPEDKPSCIVESIDMRSTTVEGAAPHAITAESLAKAHQRLRTVVQIGNAISAHLDLGDLLKEILDSFFRIFPQADRAFIMLKEEGAEEMQVQAARQRDEESVETISVSKHIINEAVTRCLGVLSANAMDDERFANAGSVMDFQIRSMMCAPLMAADEVLGVIHLDTTQQGQHFTPDDLELFTSVTNQTALAISYARMHERLLKRQRLEHELALARHVQDSFLPDESPVVPGMEFSATYRAALEVGGDFYDWISLNDGRLGIVLGDVMGKGVPAALMMVRMMSDVRFLTMSRPEPSTVLERLNESFIHRGTKNAFVTMIFMLLDPETRRLSIANAAHYPPIICKGSAGELCHLEVESGLPIGIVSGTKYAQRTISLEPRDCVVAFTDGVVEAENEQEELYGIERLMKALAAVHPPAAPLLVEKLLKDVRAFAGDTAQTDDLTVVCLGAT